jgi:hypothetical protein
MTVTNNIYQKQINYHVFNAVTNTELPELEWFLEYCYCNLNKIFKSYVLNLVNCSKFEGIPSWISLLFLGEWFQFFGLFWMVTGLLMFRPLSVLMKLNTESALLDQKNNNGMTLLGFKTILHKKCRSGKNSEGPAERGYIRECTRLILDIIVRTEEEHIPGLQTFWNLFSFCWT